MYKTFSMELAGRTLSVDIGRVAAQANGAGCIPSEKFREDLQDVKENQAIIQF